MFREHKLIISLQPGRTSSQVSRQCQCLSALSSPLIGRQLQFSASDWSIRSPRSPLIGRKLTNSWPMTCPELSGLGGGIIWLEKAGAGEAIMEMQRHKLMQQSATRPESCEHWNGEGGEKSKEMQIIFCTALTDFLVSTPFSVSQFSWGSHDLLTLSHYSLSYVQSQQSHQQLQDLLLLFCWASTVS